MLAVCCRKVRGLAELKSMHNLEQSSTKNLFHLNLRGFESRLGHLSFITYLLLIITIVHSNFEIIKDIYKMIK